MRVDTRIVGVFVGMLLGAGVAVAQSTSTTAPAEKPAAKAGPDFGTSGFTSYAVSALEFSTLDQTDTWSSVPGKPDRFLTSVDGEFEVPLHLPQGALVEVIQIEGCDFSTSGQLQASLSFAPQPAGDGSTLGSVSTDLVDAPGCKENATIITPFTVDNANNFYWLSLRNTTFDGLTYFAGARIFYVLQIHPAPGSPSFTDVDTSNPFFKAIEALYASGITTGCQTSPLKFCPDDVVTRKEMASFLARALGLYWPD